MFTRTLNTFIKVLSLNALNALSKTCKECRPVGADKKYVGPSFDSENNRCLVHMVTNGEKGR